MRPSIFSFSVAAIFLGVFATVEPAFATSATWLASPQSDDWNDPANWSPMIVPNGPNDVAMFQTSSQPTLSISSNTEVNEIVFNPGGNSFGIFVTAQLTLTISGAGVTNNSGAGQSLIANGTIAFTNSANAGDAVYLYNYGTISFGNSAGAGNAAFTNIGNTSVIFGDNSSAQNATFTNSSQSSIGFSGSASAGNASALLQGGGGTVAGATALFYGNSTAANSQFTINSGGCRDNSVNTGATVAFYNNATAGNSTLVAQGGVNPFGGCYYLGPGRVLFTEFASAGSATLIANTGPSIQESGAILFHGSYSSGGMARVKVFGNGNLDISGYLGQSVSVGSIEGDGYVILGSEQLTVGTNNIDTVFSGQIQGIYGSLAKTGTGTLTLASTTSYTGPTTIEGGVLRGSRDLVFDGAPQNGGFISVGPSGTLTLDSGVTNNYIVDRASLVLAAGSTVNLNFTGPPDRVRSLIVDGVTQPPGLYSGSGSRAAIRLPQFTGTGAIVAVAKAVSRLTHGSAGAFDIDLPLAGSPGIECRTGTGTGSDYQIVVTFYNSVTFSNASVISGIGQVASSSGSGTNTVVIDLTGVANAQIINVALGDLNDGTGPTTLIIPMGILVADVNENGTVNASDITAVKTQLGQPVTTSNFRADVNPNGIVNASDVVKVKTLLGTSLP